MTILDRLERFILNVNNQCNKTIVNNADSDFYVSKTAFLSRPFSLKCSDVVYFFLALTIFLSPAARAVTEQSPEALFKQGLSEFRLNRFSDATRTYQSLLVKEPNNPAVLSNLGLCSIKINQLGWAMAYFRKALFLDSSLVEAQSGLSEAISKIEVKELPHQNSWFETFRSSFLIKIPLDLAFAITLLTFLLAGWKALSFFGLRKRKLKEGSDSPPWPFYILIIAFVFLIFAALVSLKIYDIYILSRGTVVAKKSSLASAPEAGQSSLFDIFEGLEVEVLGQSGDFYQVQYPGGASGWILKKDLFITQ